MSVLQIVLFALASLLIGLSKGGLGGPLPVALVIPILSLVMSPAEAVPLTTPFLIFADWFALRLYWKEWNMYYVKLLLPAAVIGVIMGAFLLTAIPDNALKLIIALFTVLVIIYKLLSDRLENLNYTHQSWHGVLAGWSTALASTLANTGSPTFTTYLLLQKLRPIVFIGTATLFFAVVNALKMPFFWQQGLLDMNALYSVLWALPIVPLGVWLGRRATEIIDQTTFERILLVLLVVSVVLLLASL
jgi:hypothetical protein